MRFARISGLLVLVVALTESLSPGQQPMPTMPAYPPIAPATAKLEQTLGGLEGAGVGLAASDEAGGLFAACEGRALHYWTPDLLLGVRTSETGGGFSLRGHEGALLGVATGGKMVASWGTDGKVLLWAPPEEKPKLTLDLKMPVRSVAVAPDGKTLAASGEDGVVQLWDTEKGQAGSRITASKDWQLALAFSPDGKNLVAGGYDGKWRLFELPSGKKLQEVEAQAPPMAKDQPREVNVVTTLAFAPDGKSLVVAGQNGQLYQFQTDGKLMKAMPGHTAGVAGLAFHPTGTLLASAGKDRTIRLWTPATGQAVKTLEGHTSWVMGVGFFNKGTKLASVGADRTVKLWDLSDPTKK